MSIPKFVKRNYVYYRWQNSFENVSSWKNFENKEICTLSSSKLRRITAIRCHWLNFKTASEKQTDINCSMVAAQCSGHFWNDFLLLNQLMTGFEDLGCLLMKNLIVHFELWDSIVHFFLCSWWIVKALTQCFNRSCIV